MRPWQEAPGRHIQTDLQEVTTSCGSGFKKGEPLARKRVFDRFSNVSHIDLSDSACPWHGAPTPRSGFSVSPAQQRCKASSPLVSCNEAQNSFRPRYGGAESATKRCPGFVYEAAVDARQINTTKWVQNPRRYDATATSVGGWLRTGVTSRQDGRTRAVRHSDSFNIRRHHFG